MSEPHYLRVIDTDGKGEAFVIRADTRGQVEERMRKVRSDNPHMQVNFHGPVMNRGCFEATGYGMETK